jgi:UDP-N-acetyl-D-galactosamine dehydrogenase
VAVNHKEYTQYTEEDLVKLSTEKGILVDVKGIYRNKIHKLAYWSL